MKSNTIRNPVLTIQSDWSEQIRRPTANIWLTSKTISQKGCHQTIQFKDYKPIDCKDFEVIYSSNNYLKLLSKESKLLSTFIAPIHCFSNTHSKRISCIDVTNGGLGVSVAADNELRVWSTIDGSVRRQLIGHVFEPYFCRFFPSGEVILSGGSDMQIKIWSAITGKCAATLIGHKSAIMDSAFVERGRNIITVSRDGTAKLWDCGSKACVENLIQLEFGNAINTCALQTVGQDVDLGLRLKGPMHEKAFGTENKLLVVGTESGSVLGIGLNSNKKIFEIANKSAVNSCVFVNEFSFLFGSQSGEMELIDVRNTDKVVKCWETSASPVLCLMALKHNNNSGFFVGRADGSALFHYLDTENETIQLTGPDFEAINGLAKDDKHVFTACRDGKIRKYNINVVLNQQ